MNTKVNKIAVFLPTVDIGGAERMIATLVSNFNDKDVKIRLYIIGQFKENQITEQLKAAGVDCVYFGKTRGFSLKILKVIEKALNEYQPDVIHTNMSSLYYCLRWAKKNKVNIVHTIHTSVKRKKGFINETLIKYAYKKSYVVPVAISDYIYDELNECYKFKTLNPELIYNPVDLSKFSQKKEKKVYDFVNVGRFHPVKNHELLIKAFKVVCEKHPEAKLALAGEGERKAATETLVKELGLENNVDFLGNVSDICGLLNKSKIYVLPSNIEGFPITLLEAMACKLPVITTNFGGAEGIVKENGILVNINDVDELSREMIGLLENKQKRNELVENVENNIEQYSVKNIVEKYKQLYLKYSK